LRSITQKPEGEHGHWQPCPFAHHSCGNGHLGCVNPKHLYWGDASQNAKDAAKHKSEGKQEIKQAPRPHYRGLEGRLRRSVAQAA